jgi:hypothetical protein
VVSVLKTNGGEESRRERGSMEEQRIFGFKLENLNIFIVHFIAFS